MIKKILKPLLVTLLIGSSLFATNANSQSFDVHYYQEIAITKDIQKELSQRDITKLKEKYDEDLEKAEDINVLVGLSDKRYDSKVKKYINPIQSNDKYQLAIRNEIERLKKAAIDLENNYYLIAICKEQVNKANIEKQIAKIQLDAAKVKVDKGNYSSLDYNKAYYNHQLKQLNLLEKENNLNELYYGFNEMIGVDLDKKHDYTASFKLNIPIEFERELNLIFHNALYNVESVYQLSKNLEYANMKLQYASEEYKQDSSEYLDIYLEKVKAELDYNTAKSNLLIELNNDYTTIITSIETYKAKEINYQIEQSSYNVKLQQFINGEISKSELLESESKLLGATIDLNSIINKINNSYFNFELKYIFSK